MSSLIRCCAHGGYFYLSHVTGAGASLRLETKAASAVSSPAITAVAAYCARAVSLEMAVTRESLSAKGDAATLVRSSARAAWALNILKGHRSLREGGLHSNAANTAVIRGVRARNLDIALVSPHLAPTVFDKPIVLTRLSTITNNKNAMVELGTALARANNSTLIELKGGSVCLNGH